MKKDPIILAIESSCDDTAVAIMKGNVLLSHIVVQQPIHGYYGGVVPELASRFHQKNIFSVARQAKDLSKISKRDINAIAFTKGPGLIGSLLIGASFGKSLSLALDIPLIGIHHVQAHILAHFIDDQTGKPYPTFPFICLTVSGGHTKIVRVDDYFQMTILGTSLDDAVGEALDKMAKILGLDYPGGAWIEHYAKIGNPMKFSFSKPYVQGLDFSFSGLKTQFFYFIRKHISIDSNFIRNNFYDLCSSVQYTIVEILLDKIVKAMNHTNISQLALAGGVSSNFFLRKRFLEVSVERGWILYLLPLEYTTDNAAMIAMTAQFKYFHGLFDDLDIKPTARCAWDRYLT